jgi:hypothetical protein
MGVSWTSTTLTPRHKSPSCALISEGDSPRERALGREWRTVCAGAKKCYIALITVVISAILYVMFNAARSSFNLSSLLSSPFPLAFIVAWFLQLIGQFQLSKISRSSRAKGLFTGSFIAFVVVWVGSIVLGIVLGLVAGVQVPNSGPDASTASMFLGVLRGDPFSIANMMINIVQLAWVLMLLLGLRRMGISLQNRPIVTNSTISLVSFIILVLTKIVNSVTSGIPAELNRNTPMLIPILGFALLIAVLVTVICYANALRKIADYAKAMY